MPKVPASVRPAREADLLEVARLAAELVRLHHRFDPARFLLPDSSVETGYERFLRHAFQSKDTVVLVAARDERIIGYTYARAEPRDWHLLLDAHGAIHDLYVDPSARGLGVGRALMLATIEALGSLGAKPIVLYTAAQNDEARRLFASLGFRATMLEMTRTA